MDADVISETTENEQKFKPGTRVPLSGRGSGLIPFGPGVSGNPLGRPRGSRNRLTEDFVRALSEDFAEHGKDAVLACRQSDPSTYLKIIASLMPKELKITDQSMGDMSDGELIEILASLRDVVGGGGAVIEGSAVEEAVIVGEAGMDADDRASTPVASESDASRREPVDGSVDDGCGD